MKNFKERVKQLVDYVRKNPEFIGEIMVLHQCYGLSKVRGFFNNLDTTKSYKGTITHRGYLKNKEIIDKIISGKEAYTIEIDVVDQDYMNDKHTKNVYSKSANIYNSVVNKFWPLGREDAISCLNPLPGEKILEIGIGPGTNFKYYPAKSTVVGIDFSDEMVKLAKEEAERLSDKNISVYEIDAHSIPFPDETFDKVYSFYALCTMRNPFKVMKEINRVCKPTGHIVLFEPINSRIEDVALLQYLFQPIGREMGHVWIEDFPAYVIPYNAFLDLFRILKEVGIKTKKDMSYDPPYDIVHLVQCKKEV